jgi:exportin-5
MDHSNQPAQGPSPSSLEHISNALNATLDPRVSNDVRQQALQHLEAVKSQPDAPLNGFALASDHAQNDAVRYYGLQLLDFGIKYKWLDYNDEQTGQLRTWVQTLAVNLRANEAQFLRSKMGQLWVEVAKRCWAGEWMDMDEQLVLLWEDTSSEKSFVNKLLVLYIIEILSEDIMNSEDTVAGLRLDVVGPALNEIVITPDVYATHLTSRGTSKEVRFGQQGWLSRICELFSISVKQSRMGGEPKTIELMELCAIKSLNAIKAVVSWITFQAIEEANLVDCLFLPFHTSNVPLQIAALDVLFAVAHRHSTLQETWMGLIRQMLRADRQTALRAAYEQAYAGPGEDDEKHTLQKKMAGLLSTLADSVAQHITIVDQTVDLPSFYAFLLLTAQSKSLQVSIGAIHSWSKQLIVQENVIIDLVLAALPSLLQICSERLLRYEALAEDTEDETLQFLNDDFDTIPERHAFLGNYRRYCNVVIQSITRTRPIEALSYVLGETQSMLVNGPYSAAHGFDAATYSKNKLPVLRFDAQFNVVVSALKGYGAWTTDVAELQPTDPIHVKADKDKADAAQALQQWCTEITRIEIDDPGVTEQLMSIIVHILKILKPVPSSFALDVVHHLLVMQLGKQPQHATYTESVIAFEHARAIELQKLALLFPNELLNVYGDLEPRVNEMTQKYHEDARLVWGYRAFLFMIIHRANDIDQNVRNERLEQMLKPVYDAWTSPELATGVSSFKNFNEFLGLHDLPQFYQEKGFDRVQDWSAQQLDEAGQAKQALVKQRSDYLPLRMTKSMLAASCERLKPGTNEHESASQLWNKLIPCILPQLLPMLQHASAFSNMRNWSELPPGLQAVIQRSLQDRFWQSGISNESKEEFYARISGSKTSFEGFASTIRGTMRNVRENGYHILYFMTKFEETFYGLPNLAEPLADALFEDVISLGTNHLSAIINLATGLVQRCPPHHRVNFLPPLLKKMFVALDAKIAAEWDVVARTAEQNKLQDDDLSDEMRTESVLRQITYSMVAFVSFLLEHDKSNIPTSEMGRVRAADRPSVTSMVLSDPSILEPLILFCTHALRMQDTRCCQMICRIFRHIIPQFASPNHTSITEVVAAQVGDFICTEVLKACISSLNEPYFVDMQKDLAMLITQIIVLYSPRSQRPREVLTSLPSMDPNAVDSTIRTLLSQPAKSERNQRSMVLQLLERVRGVSIHEAGKIDRRKELAAAKKGRRSSVPQQYMKVEKIGIENGDEAGLDGVAGLFGDA